MNRNILFPQSARWPPARSPLRLINISYREWAAYCHSAFAGLYVYALLAHERHLTGHYCQRQGSL